MALLPWGSASVVVTVLCALGATSTGKRAGEGHDGKHPAEAVVDAAGAHGGRGSLGEFQCGHVEATGPKPRGHGPGKVNCPAGAAGAMPSLLAPQKDKRTHYHAATTVRCQ